MTTETLSDISFYNETSNGQRTSTLFNSLVKLFSQHNRSLSGNYTVDASN